MIEQFHFLRPAWLLTLLPLAFVIWQMLKTQRSSRSWQAVVDPALLPYLLTGEKSVRSRSPMILVGTVAALLVISLAGPVWDKLAQPVFKQQSALVIALDLSRSMDANDIKPSRLTRARHKIADILTKLKEGQTALVVYAADAFSVVPLTDDGATINALLPGLTTDMMPVQGSRADQALIQAYALFENTGLVRGDMLLVSDGLNDRESEAMQKLLKANPGFRLSILGVGSEAGGPIPLAEGGFLKDAQGSIIIARLAARPMQMLTRLGGGSFQMLSANDNDVNGLLKAIERSPFEQDVIASDRSADVWYEQGPWLVLLLLPIVALAFRRGVLLFGPLIIASILLSVTPDAHAFDWDSLWRNSNQRGQLQFEQGDHARAAELFDNPDWKASALYRAGEYDTALQQWQGNDAENANYNRGNALAKLGQLEEAIKAYDQVLQKNPQHADAIYNRKLVEDALKQQQQDPSQNDESGDKNSAEKQSSESEQGEQVDQSQQEQSDQEQQSKQSDQQQQQEEAQSQDQQTEQAKPEATESDPDMSEASLEQKLSEQAAEQWLRKIPDDPGGLLRRKFLYQYKNRGEPQSELNPW